MPRIVEMGVALAMMVLAPARGELSYRPLAPGIERAETSIRTAPQANPATIWIYRPAAKLPSRALPAVFVAPAGSNGLTGMALTDEDMAEHLPYVRQGFVVVAYSIDGAIERGATAETFLAAVGAFVKANGGIANLNAAIDRALADEPAIDVNRLYAAGHSSAGTLALRAAAECDRIRGVVAYAPVTDTTSRFDNATLAAIEPSVQGITNLIRERAPRSQTASVKVPVMLFHATNDETVPIEQTRAYAAALTKAGNPPLMAEASRGGHYDALLLEGLSAGATWLADRAKRDATTQPTK